MFKFVKSWREHFEKDIATPEPEKVKVGYLQPFQDVVDGVVVTKVKFVGDTDERNVHKVSDYALSNLLAAKVPLEKSNFGTGNLETIQYMEENLSNVKN